MTDIVDRVVLAITNYVYWHSQENKCGSSMGHQGTKNAEIFLKEALTEAFGEMNERKL